MRKLIIVLTLLTCATAPAMAQTARDRAAERRAQQEERRAQRDQQRRNEESQTERISKTFSIGAEGELDVSNIAGDIVVTRGAGGSATIEAVKTARGDDARGVLALVVVDMVERGNRVEVRTRYPDWEELRRRNRRNINVEVDYTITAPANTRIIGKSISGSVSVRDIVGALTVESTSGNVTVANAGRVVTAKSISGDVEALDTKIDGTLEASSISGTVRVRRTSARSATLNTVSGSVVVEDVKCDRIEGQTVSGSVTFSGDLEPGGRYEFGSHSGTVKVMVGTGKTGFQLEATTFSGSINTELPLTMQGTGGQGRRQRSMRATFGNGGATLVLNAFSGDILIVKR